MSYRDRRDSYGSSRDRHDSRRSGTSSSRRSPSPPPKPRSDKELPESFGRIGETAKDDDSNVLQRMSKKFVNAPLGSLTKCLEGSRKIKVWTRNFKEVRGICTGYVVAFDKHWNLVMSDVDEVYLKRKKYKTPFFDDLQSAENFSELPKKIPKEKKDPKPMETRENQPPAEESKASSPEIEPPSQKSEPPSQESEPPSQESEPPAKENQPPAEKAAEGDAATTGEKKKKRRKKKKGSAPQKRHVKQMFVRGDSIVMAAILDSEDDGQ